MKAAKEALDAGISVCKPGGCLSDIGFAIHDVVDKYGFDSVREYRGHGIGSDFHIAPYVKVRKSLNTFPCSLFKFPNYFAFVALQKC